MTALYVDGDTCPVREEVYRVADRLRLAVFVVSNGSRPIRPSGRPNVQLVTVAAEPDAADDWIVDRITAADVCVTADIPLASRCLAKAARAVAPNGKQWTSDNIGNALAGRELSRHLRKLGIASGGPPPLSKQHRARSYRAGCRRAGGAAPGWPVPRSRIGDPIPYHVAAGEAAGSPIHPIMAGLDPAIHGLRGETPTAPRFCCFESSPASRGWRPCARHGDAAPASWRNTSTRSDSAWGGAPGREGLAPHAIDQRKTALAEGEPIVWA